MVGLLPQFLDRNFGGFRDFAEILVPKNLDEVDIEPGLEVEVDFAVGMDFLIEMLSENWQSCCHFLASAGFGAFRSSQ